MATPALETLDTPEARFNARLGLHANDVAEALPDDPEEALIVLTGVLATCSAVRCEEAGLSIKDETFRVVEALCHAVVAVDER